MKPTVVGVGGLTVSRKNGTLLRVLGLGSCVAVIAYDGCSGVCGIVHVALPDSALTPDAPALRPGYYADLAIPALLGAMVVEGASGAWHGYAVSLVGGAVIFDQEKLFDIGARNLSAIGKLLSERGIVPMAEHTGGETIRSVSVRVGTGEVVVTSPGAFAAN